MPAKNPSGKQRFLIPSLSGIATNLKRPFVSILHFLLGILLAQLAVQAQTAPNQKEYVYLGGKLLAVESVAGCTGGTAPIAPQPAPHPADTVWVEDQAPTGVTLAGTWTWDTTQKASGAQSHTQPAAPGPHQHYFFYGASPALYVSANDTLVTYVLVNPCYPPQRD